ncbi:MAG: GNAT family N-acetyltransferase [candidate division KSB1 bacterium]|nr:GNAT family N-acetyltransferase [candidate division KSB1 bacterium]MDZ7276108.1 GNAT family N-acetyltransferase [candidate division KSB1 bacterium]MDZ7287112.1 GNAT family N-acetyltransferase [candidate division KSB1 bacterium]MDZ7296963.1 GNAT family N-acetyltransferase [candidate division KSB1 bacterium]MDZ7306208.1 GNAT family N-acetyltransferase [candidate division KSB1 bacterium]
MSELQSVHAEWNSVLAASGSENIHLRHEWLMSWATHLLPPGRLFVLRLRAGGETIGFAPLQIRRRRLRGMLPYRQLLFLGDPESDFADFIITRHRAEALQAILATLEREDAWAEILLHNIPETSPNLPVLRELLAGKNASIRPQTKCYYVDMQDKTWEQYLPTTSKSFVQQDLRRLYNHLREREWQVVESPLQDIPRELAIIHHLHGCSQQRKGRQSYYADERYRAFIAGMITNLNRLGAIRLFYLLIDQKPAAFVLGFVFQRVFYYWNIGFDSAFEKLSPSKVLLAEVMKRCFQTGMQEFNFMRGDSDYKTRWTGSFRLNFQLRWLRETGFYGLLNKYRSHTGVA